MVAVFITHLGPYGLGRNTESQPGIYVRWKETNQAVRSLIPGFSRPSRLPQTPSEPALCPVSSTYPSGNFSISLLMSSMALAQDSHHH
jgi:hypothetical protein